MAGANGPTSVGGTTDTPNPEGGATAKPATGREAKPEAAAEAEDVETPTSKPGDAGGFSLDKDAQD